MKVFSRVLVLGRVAAAHVSAFQAQPQMDPPIAQLDAFRANVNIGVSNLDLIEMSTSFRHLFPPIN